MIRNDLLGAKLKTARQKLKLTIEELSKKSGISVATICNLENGKMTPQAITLSRLCDALNINLENLEGE